jgi:hypothetical protein
MSFLAPGTRNHDESRACVFDWKEDKRDILKSMRPNAFCDECRDSLIADGQMLSPQQFASLDTLFDLAGKILSGGVPESKPRIFIGSSVEGLRIAESLKALLPDQDVSIWHEEGIFKLGSATLEALEAALSKFQFGIFVFTPDDTIQTRGEIKPVARDNVIFELGMFVGRLGRWRAVVVNPSRRAIALPTDLSGITTAVYSTDVDEQEESLKDVARLLGSAIRAAGLSGET